VPTGRCARVRLDVQEPGQLRGQGSYRRMLLDEARPQRDSLIT
jgi:hypothetical protein